MFPVHSLAHDGHAALQHAPGFLEDQQVVRTFAGELERRGVRCSMIQTPAALPRSCTVLVRFYQIEWLTRWMELLSSMRIPVVNPTIPVISESKRFALAFTEASGYPVWRTLAQECRDPPDVDSGDWESWVLKACYSNTGDWVILCGNLTDKDRQRAVREAQRHPLQWVAQRRSETQPVESCRGGESL